MAKTNTGTLKDDITGGRGAETVSFALDSKNYEITLNKRNAAALRKLVGGYITAGRPAGTVVEIVAEEPSGQRRVTRVGATRRKAKATRGKRSSGTGTRSRTGATSSPNSEPAKAAASKPTRTTSRGKAAASSTPARGSGRGKSKPSSKPARRSARGTASTAPSQAEIRSWAVAQGIEVSARGRVANAVRDQYLAAQAS